MYNNQPLYIPCFANLRLHARKLKMKIGWQYFNKKKMHSWILQGLRQNEREHTKNDYYKSKLKRQLNIILNQKQALLHMIVHVCPRWVRTQMCVIKQNATVNMCGKMVKRKQATQGKHQKKHTPRKLPCKNIYNNNFLLFAFVERNKNKSLTETV